MKKPKPAPSLENCGNTGVSFADEMIPPADPSAELEPGFIVRGQLVKLIAASFAAGKSPSDGFPPQMTVGSADGALKAVYHHDSRVKELERKLDSLTRGEISYLKTALADSRRREAISNTKVRALTKRIKELGPAVSLSSQIGHAINEHSERLMDVSGAIRVEGRRLCSEVWAINEARSHLRTDIERLEQLLRPKPSRLRKWLRGLFFR